MTAPRPLLSSSWYRVAAVKPALRAHVRTHQQRYRGQLWYVLQDSATGRFYRFTPQARIIIAGLDGKTTLQELWVRAQEQLRDDAPTQDEVIHLLGSLHAADMLQGGISPDTAELLDRYRRARRRTWWSRFANPMALRFPLWDPDAFLRRTVAWVRWFFGPIGMIVWLAAVIPACVLALMHLPELTENVSERVLGAGNLLLLWFVFPVVKALHELGHAYATRARGGEVHEMGIMLLVLAPVPYVDATASYGFPSKWRRAQVGVAGMWVEVLLAALAMYVWLLVEPGPVRTVAYNVMVIGGVSTLLFNGNPLLRFDGYYVLSDLVEIPNMGPRANRYLAYLVERYWFRLRHAEAPIATRGERIWFVCYAPMAFVYRVFISMAVALFVATQFFVVGIAVALWSVAMLVGVPLYKTVSYFSRNPALGKRRARVVAATAGAVGVLALVLCAIPMPHSTRSEGVVWLPDDAVVRAGADGFVRRVAAAPGEPVRPGDLLIECDNPGLLAELRVLEAKVDEARARYDAQWTRDKVAAELARRELELAQSNLQRTQERASGLALLSQVSGVFILPDAQDLPGRYVRKGEPLGYVVTPERGLVRVVLEQRHVDLVRHWTRRVEVKLTHRLGETFEARIGREVPQASEDLPSAALGSLGGGRIATDPRDDHGTKTLQRVFQVDVALPPGAPIPAYGGRVYLRFQHEPEPLATQAYRAVRQLLLSRLDV